MKIRLSSSNPFNLEITLRCGQAFRWEKLGEWWYGVVLDNVLKIRQRSNELEFENANVDFVKNYFGLNEDLTKILSLISRDGIIRKAIEAFKGLRILRQDPWECLISYICATYKNIKAIKQILTALCKKFGDKFELDGYSFYAFPPPEKLAKATVAELANCGVGYRAEYISRTAKKVRESGFDFECLRKRSYEEARNELLAFPGVGLKVADCVLLFSLGKLEAFPIDVWIKRAILKHYANYFQKDFAKRISSKTGLTRSEYKKINSFGREYFGEYAGYAQEYLYHYERTYGLD